MIGVEKLLDGRHICVCAGSGGVGKTTTAAAIATGMAAGGLKVAVLTIDPARRLANSLGLTELGNEARQVDPGRFVAAGVNMKGELWAMMLDPKRTFDELIAKHAPDEATRDRILANRIYQQVSNAIAGSQEYMAMEKVYELHMERRFDLLVLDTPPTRNALDFIEAPERLSRFIDSKVLGLFLAPGRSGLKIFARGSGLLLTALKRVTGADLLQDLSEFFAAFADMAEGFRQRAVETNRLLRDPRTTFLLVSSPQRDAVDEAIFFRRKLADAGIPFGGVVVNRTHEAEAAPAGGDVEAELEAVLGDGLARKVARNFEDWRRLALRDRDSVARLTGELDGEPVILVPHLDDDVHDVGGLVRMNAHLFGRGRIRP